ncbi:NAD(+) diphosphatase [uncultured Bifidobacterium sp.]|uniref:NAD(+) diphosphatase n=1 Tax=uncultured Bifidobacterium sp. TaxID=165187 RepID=UPI0037DC1BE1
MPMLPMLSLTLPLPFLPLAQGDIDYEVDRRSDPGLIDEALDHPGTQVMLVRSGRIAVPRGQGALAVTDNRRMRLATLPGHYVLDELRRHPEAIAVYLGAYVRDEPVTHAVALDVTAVGGVRDMASVVPDSAHEGADDAFDDTVAPSSPPSRPVSLLQRTVEGFDWVDLRDFAPHANARQAGQATTAAALSLWHSRQRRCPACGAPVVPALSGWAQRCTNRDDGERVLFPRVEPAVITSIVDHHDRLLLQHNAAWKDDRLYSVSAGFVEAGENLEHACRREAREETGVRLGRVRYLGSQPWPFPASLMMAFKAEAEGTDIQVDRQETVDARWMTRDEYTAELLDGRMVAPGRATIARYMVEEWYGHDLPR